MNDGESRIARVALLVSLAIAWLNLLLTSRWAQVPGSLNGGKKPFFITALLIASALAWRARPGRARAGSLPVVTLAAGSIILASAFLSWFPPGTWNLVPFLDDWPPRFQSTLQGVALLRHATFTGWQWAFLGGYPVVTDVTQDLTIWGALPMLLLGPARGFHALHLLLFAAIPLLVWLDLSLENGGRDDIRAAATGFAALFAASYGYILVRSGDTNSLAGVVSVALVLYAAHAARRGSRVASATLPLALTICYYSHRGFFFYALCFLAVDAVVSRDLASLVRAIVSAAAAIVAGLADSWELWRYPSYFLANNVALHPAPFALSSFARQLYYNVEILTRPGRWFNDYTGLTTVLLPVVAVAAWIAKGRARTYAWFTLGVAAMVRLNYQWFGYVFIRPIHLLPVFLAPVCAWIVCRMSGGKALGWALTAVFVLYIQIVFFQVQHVPGVESYAPALVQRIRTAPGYLVLVENAFHRDVDTTSGESVPTPFPSHFEALLPAATGRLLYAGMWDGWQWTPYRDQIFASGTFRGQPLASVDGATLLAELHRWGVVSLFVWSVPALRFLDSNSGFHRVGVADRWTEFRVDRPDGRSAVADTGTAALFDQSPHGGRVRLQGVRAGSRVILRANYHPAWTASVGQAPIPISDAGGQLAFLAPRDGTYEVQLTYPQHPWLIGIAIAAITIGGWGSAAVSGRTSVRQSLAAT
ncbi:MAG TPA: hypothetical protein VL262_12420 [Vicinamibacterales bacterium]|nr:hypothetical protein [Vicinamibacterales bacterium]